jgi:hypothetical protein
VREQNFGRNPAPSDCARTLRETESFSSKPERLVESAKIARGIEPQGVSWKTRLVCLVAILGVAACAVEQIPGATVNAPNGITVADVKFLDDQLLQQNLSALSARLGAVSGIDQGTLLSHIGSTQGASATENLFSLQATTMPVPGVTTTAGQGTPSTVTTNSNTTSTGTSPQTVTTNSTSSGSAATVPTSATSVVTTTSASTAGTTSQTVTTVPGSTSQTVTTQPSVTPSPAPLPATATPALPSGYSVSSLNALSEEMQLSYQLINLQALVQGALSDDYTADGRAKSHVTLGFPISLDATGHAGDAAEVEVTVCVASAANAGDDQSPGAKAQDQSIDDAPSDEPAKVRYRLSDNTTIDLDEVPTLRTIIPQAKTYNTAKILNDTSQLGLGATIARVIEIGASYLSGHQTYYLVQEQDTIAQQHLSNKIFSRKADDPICKPAKSLVFSWQFRPVLGQSTVEPSPISTLAQIALPPSAFDPANKTGEANKARKLNIIIDSCWRKYDQDSATVGKFIRESCRNNATIERYKTFYYTVNPQHVRVTDNEDGTMTVRVHGSFQTGTRVGTGDIYLNGSSPGFEPNSTFIRFSVPNQLLAVKGARLVTADGRDVWITEPQKKKITGPRKNAGDHEDDLFPDCFAPRTALINDAASVETYSDTQIKVTVDLASVVCKSGDQTNYYEGQLSLPSGDVDGPFPFVVILNGKAFGLSDAPFKSIDKKTNKITFVVQNALLQGQNSLILRRLFFNDGHHDLTYTLKWTKPAPIQSTDEVAVSGITQIGAAKEGPEFAITGSNLQNATIGYPTDLAPCVTGSSLMIFTLPTAEAKTTKQILLATPSGPPVFVALPASSGSGSSSTNTELKVAYLGSTVSADGSSGKSTFALTGPKGSGLDRDALIFVYPHGIEKDTDPNAKKADSYATFVMPTETAKSTKMIAVQLPPKTQSGGRTPVEGEAKKAAFISPMPITGQPMQKKDNRPKSCTAPTNSSLSPGVTLPTGQSGAGDASSTGDNAPVILALPPVDASTAAGKAILLPNTSPVTKGDNSKPYSIEGSNVQLVYEIRYLNVPVAFTTSEDGTSISIPQLPPGLVANSGDSPLEIRSIDCTRQEYMVVVR